MAGFLSVANFLINLVFSLLIYIMWLKVILRYFRVSHLHPFGSIVYNFINPVSLPLEKILYKNSKSLPRYDWLSLVLILILELIKFILLGLVVYGGILSFGYLLIFTLADFIINPCNLLFYTLLLRVILSWVNTNWQEHPAAGILIMITDPMIALGRKIIPDISGFDFSPFVMMIILKIISLFISASVPGALV